MQAVATKLTRRRFLTRALSAVALSSSSSLSKLLSSPAGDSTISHATNTCLTPPPWSATQHRGARVQGADVRPGNVIQKKDRIYQVIKVEHSHEGRGKANIKLELRDVNSGNKTSQRLGTEETVDRVFVTSKSYVYMCTDRDGKVLLMDPETLDQLEVNEDVFGKNAKYLQEEMKVKVELFNGTPLSASVPKHVTCTIKEAQPPIKGIAATPKDKIATTQNGFIVKVPAHIVAGDSVVIDTEDDSYVRRAKA
ncbi:PREDICTED: uncharacterized protein LOC101311259 [Fragaria vesca subsp. vesca]|uniref:uncharacterized protein LOC101311259 n=1 Tax=Fragaria vesca subsp. vesca TaxID=101020 RepID=UPI0002C30A3D|nr:PREDICTED: uncharacterized protein LOC101311259 [Fragaria vesca subsp. vesca]